MLTVKIAKLATIHDRFCACASDFLDGDLRLSESPVTLTARSLLLARPSAPRETPRQNRDLRCSIYAPTTRLTAPGISRVENPRTFTDPSRSLRFPQYITPTKVQHAQAAAITQHAQAAAILRPAGSDSE